MKLLCRTLLVTSLGLACQPGFAASADELILACEKLQRAEDRSICLKEAVKAVAASSTAPSRSTQAAAAVVAAESVMKALRRLESATEIGITLRDYSQLLVTETANIDEGLRSVPDGPFKNAVMKSRQAYIDARVLWSLSIVSTYVSVFQSSAEPMFRLYGIDPSELYNTSNFRKTSDIPKVIFLSPIWLAAGLETIVAQRELASLATPGAVKPKPDPVSARVATALPLPAVASPAPAPSATSEANTSPAARRQATPEDQRVLTALRRLDATADTGPGLNEYAKLSTAGVAEVDAALGNIPNDAFRNNVLAARQAYVDAHQVWYWAEQYQYLSQFADAAGPTLRTYGVLPSTMNSTGIREMRLMPRHIFLFPIWSAARIYIDAAEASLASPEATKPLPNKPSTNKVEAPAEAGASRGAAALRKAEEIRKAEELRKTTGQDKADDPGKVDAQRGKQAP